MTTKEKAKELINKFMFSEIYFTNGHEGALLNAKFCSIQCVNEILNLDSGDTIDKYYYEKVKEEIKNL